MFQRYAVFHTSVPGSPLADFGAAWLGWDSARGQPCAHPDIAGIGMGTDTDIGMGIGTGIGMAIDVAEVTATPRKYGFHGTIKPPFRLATGATQADLHDALHRFTLHTAPVSLDGLDLARLGRFLALVARGDVQGLSDLAGQVVARLDPFRAPPPPAELARRRAAGLTAAQEAHLTRWGYPYVMDQFRFHMTLTGRMAKPRARRVEAALHHALRGIDRAPYAIDSLTLMGEDATGLFHQIARMPLMGHADAREGQP